MAEVDILYDETRIPTPAESPVYSPLPPAVSADGSVKPIVPPTMPAVPTSNGNEYTIPAAIDNVPASTPGMMLQIQPQSVPQSVPQTSLPNPAGQPNASQKLRLEPYTAKSFMVRGDTKPYSSALSGMSGTWIHNPRQGVNPEPGWCFSLKRQTEVQVYIDGVNGGSIEAPPPSAQTQRLNWTVFRPDNGMKLRITMPHGTGEYQVLSTTREGYVVMEAIIYQPTDHEKRHRMVIMGGKWQIFGYKDKHTIEPVI